MPRLVLGSRNKKKLREMIDLLGDLGHELTDLTPYPRAPEVAETADTFAGNATLKATQLAPALGAWVIGEDSGLCVPALGGAPGVHSARYAGTHGDDAANNAKLLREMAALTGEARAAYYVSTAVLADPTGKVIASVEGRCHGIIVDAPRGAGGFGYDPLFLVPEFGKTFGELPPVVKQSMSHRARAFRELRPTIERVLLSVARACATEVPKLEVPEGYEVLMGSDVRRGGMYLELWTRPSHELVLWAFYSDAEGTIEFESYRSDVPPDVESWFEQEARRRLPQSTT